MKRLMAERTAQHQQQQHQQQQKQHNLHHNTAAPSTEEIWSGRRHNTAGIIDGNFLSMAFGGALLVIVSVSVYAFYNLYHAILKKFPSKHEEL